MVADFPLSALLKKWFEQPMLEAGGSNCGLPWTVQDHLAKTYYVLPVVHRDPTVSP